MALPSHPEITLARFEKWYDSDLSKEELVNYDVHSELNYLRDNSQQLEKSMHNFYRKWIAFKH